ncbi:MAG TPA: IPT/TIG domain-containing protein [Holophagaceae bacterium]|nr:IPT/TIG domain-containing protein [Holophagaceae bacterium]
MSRSTFLSPATLLGSASLIVSLACGGGGGGSTSPTPPPATGTQVLLNGGFELTSPMAWKGDTGVIQPAPGSSASFAVPHGGANFAWLGGYGYVNSDEITQDVFVPASAQSATLTFWLKVVTEETGATVHDTMTVRVLSTLGAPLGTLGTSSNANAGNYTKVTYNLKPYAGQVVRLDFKSLEDATKATHFLVDDVAVAIQVPAAADLKPLVDAFTPTSGVLGESIVTLAGRNFFGVTEVSIGGQAATFTLTDGTLLTATVPASATTGSAPIAVTNAQGTGTSALTFTTAYGTPSKIGVNPGQGPIGTPVVIAGTYLGYPGTTVSFNGINAPLTSQSAGQLTVNVPATATTGNLVVTTPGGSFSQAFTVNTASTTLDLHVDKIQLTQSTQTLANSVPIVAGKAAFARVFVLANQTNAASPSVQVTLFNGGVPVPTYPKTIPPSASGVPTAIDESSLAMSWNLVIPATDLTTPVGAGYSLEATVDPAGGLIPEADETNNTTAVGFTSTTVPTFHSTIFPVVLASGTGDVSNLGQWVYQLQKMYPVADVDVVAGSPFTGSVSTLGSDGTGWNTLLNDLTTKHQLDGASNRYYYGSLKVGYGGGVAGLGWVPNSPSSAFQQRTAIGWDKTGYGDGGDYTYVFAHETGHTMGREHSPCGGAAGPDPNYPYAGGSIGMWGYDTVQNQLKDPSVTKDIMGYCSPNWVSDYVYTKILQFRAGSGGFLHAPEDAALPAALATPTECLILRGILREDGRVDLLPSFRTRSLPSARPTSGDLEITGQDETGRTLFTVPLELMTLGCGPHARDRHFVMALPLPTSSLDALCGLQVTQAGQVLATRRSTATVARAFAAPAAEPEARMLKPGFVALRWDASVESAALVRDADTGEVIALLTGGSQTLPTRARRLEVVLSDGVVSRTRRLDLLN